MCKEIQIRVATAEDMPIIERVLGVDQGFFYRRRLARGAVILSAWLTGEPVATICISFEPADEPQITRHLPDVPLLYRLHVKEDQRNKGIGTRLLRGAEHLLLERGHKQVAFGVDVHNGRAMRLYRSLGYKEWEFGEIDTVRELYTIDGGLDTLPDRCMIFVKHFTT